MAFTGQLGTSDSYLANIVLGLASSSTSSTITGVAGIASEEAFGADGIIYEALIDGRSAAGIPSLEAFGADGSITGSITGSTGIASEEAFGDGGTAWVYEQLLSGSTGIASEEAFGADGAVSGPLVGSAGIASEEAFGADGALSGPITGTVGIASEEAFGTNGSLTGPITGSTGIASEEAFGADGAVATIVGSKGIPSLEAFGADGSLYGSITALFPGIESAEEFGQTGIVFVSDPNDCPFRIYISGADRTQYLLESDFSIRRQLNLSSTADLKVYTNDGSYMPVIGEPILIYHWVEAESAWHRIFGGTIDSNVITRNVAGYQLFGALSMVDYSYALKRRRITMSFPAETYGTFTSIMSYINTTYLEPEGLHWVSQGDPGIDIGDVEFNCVTIHEALTTLGELVNWNYTVDYFKNLYFYSLPAGETAAPWGIDETSENWFDMSVTRSRGLYANRIILKVSQTSASGVSAVTNSIVTERYYAGTLLQTEPHGNDEYDLQFILWPPDNKANLLSDSRYSGRVVEFISMKRNGTEDLTWWIQENHLWDPPESDWDIVVATADSVYLRWNMNDKPDEAFADGEFLDIEMEVIDVSDASTPEAGQVQDDDEIAARAAIEGGTGIYTMVVDVSGISDPDVLAEYAQSLLDRFSVIGLEIKFDTRVYGLEPGQEIAVSLPNHGVTETTAVIESVDMASEQMRSLRYSVKASNEVQQSDSLTAFQRLIKRLQKDTDTDYTEVTFILAQDLYPLTNPGLVTGESVTNAKVLQVDLNVSHVSVYFKDAAQGAAIKLDIKADGVSIFSTPIIYPEGSENLEYKYTNFTANPLVLAAGTVLTIDVVQTGTTSPGKNGTVTILGQ